jgi:Flp pilus assembly protein TadD
MLYGKVLAQEGEIVAAEQALQQAVTRYPIDPTAFLEYATVAERLGHVAEARRAMLDYEALTFDDANAPSRASRIGALSLRLNDAPAALMWLQRAVAGAPNDLRAVSNLADAQLRSGDRAAAQATVMAGLVKDPTNPALLTLQRRFGLTARVSAADPSGPADRHQEN